MQITVVNLSAVADTDVLPVLRAINRQIAEDFVPYWGQPAALRFEGHAVSVPDRDQPAGLRGDAVIYLRDHADVAGALGYHNQNNVGLPCGFVFTELSRAIGEQWTVTLSHEALELIGDANVNKLAAGPHPADPNRWVLHWYEMCDAVQAESYLIDGVAVSNFLLPLYFTPGEQAGGRNDFLGAAPGGSPLPSFGVNPGGYLGYLDPATGKMGTWVRPEDAEALRRLAVKQQAGATRRSVRKANLPELSVAPDLAAARAATPISD
ncbi:MAG: hypothetical protein ACQSGP_26005 [Frankia sp.]